MLKLVGALMIFAACAGAGILTASMYKKRVAQLEAFALLIAHIEAQIGGFLTPLDRIYEDFKNRELDACGFLDALRNKGGLTALSDWDGRLYLTRDEIGELEKFFSGLGRHSADEEMRHCAYFEKRMGELCADARAKLGPKMRVCRAFGMLVGVMLALVLL